MDIVSDPLSSTDNPYGNAFRPVESIIRNEDEARRLYDANKARSWKISNAEGKANPITGKPVAYKLIPFSQGPAMPPLLTHPEASTVSSKGEFATKHLWVTPFDEEERFPAGEYTPQQMKPDGLPSWSRGRNIEEEDIVLWHSFGVAHVPRVEDFPIMVSAFCYCMFCSC